MQRSTFRLIWVSLSAFAIFTPAPLAAQSRLEEATMALPVASLSFSMTYLADDLNLWEKHGVKIKTMEISGIGAMSAAMKKLKIGGYGSPLSPGRQS